MTAIDWSKKKMVIFDVDGTLYDQRRLRFYMLCRLLSYYLLRPLRVGELRILKVFRRERERHISEPVKNLEQAQYIWAARYLGIGADKIFSVVEQWIFNAPLQYMPFCRYPGVTELFHNLRKNQIKIAILSDYPAINKLKALGLEADLIVAATDGSVDRLKPDPRGLFHILDLEDLSVNDCIYIGDRNEHDGECARRACMQYLIKGRKSKIDEARFSSYHELNQQLAEGLSINCKKER